MSLGSESFPFKKWFQILLSVSHHFQSNMFTTVWPHFNLDQYNTKICYNRVRPRTPVRGESTILHFPRNCMKSTSDWSHFSNWFECVFRVSNSHIKNIANGHKLPKSIFIDLRTFIFACAPMNVHLLVHIFTTFVWKICTISGGWILPIKYWCYFLQ